MTGEAKSNPLATMKQLFTPFLGGVKEAGKSDDATIRSAYESATKLAALIDERGRLRKLESDETGKLEDLGARLRKSDGERISALTEHRISANASAKENAQTLLKECDAIRQEIADANGVAREIKSRIEVLDEQIKTTARIYRGDLGVFLTGIYGRLIDRYNEAAPVVAEIVLQLGAVNRVMHRFSAGSNTGWNGQMLLPGMKAMHSGPIEPILDAGSDRYDREATERMDGILAEMRAAGFISRLD